MINYEETEFGYLSEGGELVIKGTEEEIALLEDNEASITKFDAEAKNKATHEAIEREWRDAELIIADVGVNKAVDNNNGSDVVWRIYRVSLRDYPTKDGFPFCERPFILT